jgi:hypothetical protein
MGVYIGVTYTCELDAFVTIVSRTTVRGGSVIKRRPSSGHVGQNK